MRRSAIRVAVAVAVVLTLPLVAMQFTDEVVWTLSDFVVVGVLLATIGIAIELALKNAGNRALAAGIAVLGVAAAWVGGDADAPGLILIGILLVASACAVGVRAPARSE